MVFLVVMGDYSYIAENWIPLAFAFGVLVSYLTITTTLVNNLGENTGAPNSLLDLVRKPKDIGSSEDGLLKTVNS